FTLYLPLSHYPSGDPRQHEYIAPPVAAMPAAPLEPLKPPEEAAGEKAEGELNGRCVLVVDDDIRNVFALTSALEARGLRVMHAESGKEGIELLKRQSGVDAVLMDVMM